MPSEEAGAKLSGEGGRTAAAVGEAQVPVTQGSRDSGRVPSVACPLLRFYPSLRVMPRPLDWSAVTEHSLDATIVVTPHDVSSPPPLALLYADMEPSSLPKSLIPSSPPTCSSLDESQATSAGQDLICNKKKTKKKGSMSQFRRQAPGS